MGKRTLWHIASMAMFMLSFQTANAQTQERNFNVIPALPLKDDPQRAELVFLLNDPQFSDWIKSSGEITLPNGETGLTIIVTTGVVLQGKNKKEKGKKFLVDIRTVPNSLCPPERTEVIIFSPEDAKDAAREIKQKILKSFPADPPPSPKPDEKAAP